MFTSAGEIMNFFSKGNLEFSSFPFVSSESGHSSFIISSIVIGHGSRCPNISPFLRNIDSFSAKFN